MAETDRKFDSGIEGNADTEKKPVRRKRNTNTESTAEGRTGTAGTDTGTATGTDTEKEKPVGMAVVEDNTDIAPTPGQPKKAKRKRTKAQKSNDAVFNAEQIKSLIMTFSTIGSQTEVGKIFALSEVEAEQIATPIANIIAKNESFAKLGEHSDAVALVTACMIIFTPRIIAYMSYAKSKKMMKDKNVMILKGEKQNGTQKPDSRNNGKTEGASTMEHEGNGSSIMSGLAPLAF